MATGREADLWLECERASDELYTIRDTYFPPDAVAKNQKLQLQSDLCRSLLDSIPLEHRKSPLERARYEYLLGKILDVDPEYRKDAEDHLSKAVKLNPSLADAWLFLGNCLWKKGELPAAKNCFNLALSKGPNKKIFRALSMLERCLAQDATNPDQLIDESIQHAKAAISIDVTDGSSWYNLANAFFTSFFVSGAWDHSKLQQSLKAYQNAEKDELMRSIPDLYYHQAAVNRYLENYERALTGFETAAAMDPGLNADLEVQKMVDLLNNIDRLLKGHGKSKRPASSSPLNEATNMNPAVKRVSIDELSEGSNEGVAVLGKVLHFIKNDNSIPLYFLVGGSSNSTFILTVYGVHSDAIKQGDQLSLFRPCFRHVVFSWKNKEYDFRSVRVDFLEQLIVNGRAVPSHLAVRSSVFAQHKP